MNFETFPPKRPLSRGAITRTLIVTLSTLLLAAFASAGDQEAAREKLTGTWQGQGNGETWTLKDTGDSIHVSIAKNTQTVADFECNTVGKECAIKRSGHKSTVTLYFNGPRLVELETMGEQIVKRRFIVTGSGDTMDLEIIPIAPSGPVATAHFTRVSVSK